MHPSQIPPTSDRLTSYEAQALLLEDPRPYPQDEALHQLGHALMNLAGLKIVEVATVGSFLALLTLCLMRHREAMRNGIRWDIAERLADCNFAKTGFRLRLIGVKELRDGVQVGECRDSGRDQR